MRHRCDLASASIEYPAAFGEPALTRCCTRCFSVATLNRIFEKRREPDRPKPSPVKNVDSRHQSARGSLARRTCKPVVRPLIRPERCGGHPPPLIGCSQSLASRCAMYT